MQFQLPVITKDQSLLLLMFGAHVKVLLIGKGDSGLVIDVDESGFVLGKVEFGEGTTKPNGFASCVGKCHVFCFHA